MSSSTLSTSSVAPRSVSTCQVLGVAKVLTERMRSISGTATAPPRHCAICGNHCLGVPGLFTGIGAAHAASGEKIGTVDTAFQWIGRDHDTTGEAYDNPGIPGATC